jgi:hypothetical protein
LKPVAFKLWVNRVQLAPPHRVQQRGVGREHEVRARQGVARGVVRARLVPRRSGCKLNVIKQNLYNREKFDKICNREITRKVQGLKPGAFKGCGSNE